MRDVAERAGVSVTTVSHVINETRVVSEGSRQRVLAAMDKLGYQPNALARSLRRQIEHATGPMRFTTPVSEIPSGEYHDQVQDWQG